MLKARTKQRALEEAIALSGFLVTPLARGGTPLTRLGLV